MSQEQTISSPKEPPMTIRLSTPDKIFFREFKQKNRIKTDTKAWEEILKELRNSKGSQTLRPSLPEGCYRCNLKGLLTINKKGETIVRCIERIENKQPIIKDRGISEAEACSQKPTYITMAMKETFEFKIQMLEAQLAREAENTDALQRKDDYYELLRKKLIDKDSDIKSLENYQEQIEEQLKEANKNLQPMQDLLTEKDTLNSKVSDMENALLRRDEKITILETDNEQQRKTIEELSHDTLIETNRELINQLEEEKQGRKVQLAQKDSLIDEYKIEIEKLEALTKTRRQTLNEVISKTMSVFRDFKQFLPSQLNLNCMQCVDSFEIKEYITNCRKTIEAFEGYLETMIATPKDNILRGS